MKIHRLTALLLSLLLLFSCALAESTDDKLMATVNGEELRYSAYVTYLTQYQQLLSGAYDETDETQAAYIEDLALTTAIQDMLIEQDMRAKGCYDFDEETENSIQERDNRLRTALTNVGEVLRAELGYSDEEDMSSFALSYAKALGVTAEDYIAVYRKQRAMVNYYTVLLGDNPVTEVRSVRLRDKRGGKQGALRGRRRGIRDGAVFWRRSVVQAGGLPQHPANSPAC